MNKPQYRRTTKEGQGRVDIAVQKLPTDEQLNKKIKVKPTDLSKVLLPGANSAKIRRAFDLCLKYDGDLYKAAAEAGYSRTSLKNLSRIVKTDSWQELIRHYFPTYKLFEKANMLLDHTDWRATAEALKMIFKLRGDFIAHLKISVDPRGDYQQMSNDELRRIADGQADVIDGDAITEKIYEEGEIEDGSEDVPEAGEDRTGEKGTEPA